MPRHAKRTRPPPRRARAPKSRWRDRIVGTDRVDPRTLVAHDRNWRTHPDAQLKALAGAIGRIGFIRSITVNRRTGRILDGHARVRLALDTRQARVPVEYVDLSEQEELEALVTLDPIAAMARADEALLAELRDDVQLDSKIFDGLEAELDRILALDDPGDAGANTDDTAPPRPHKQITLVDQFKIVLSCRDEQHQTDLLEALEANDIKALRPLLHGIEYRALMG